jgi:predicted nucleotidyltransferase component of viral defense system
MNVIAQESFKREWIEGFRATYPLVTLTLMEKTIYAFELLGLLVHSGKDFIFKGGTSLLLLLPNINRLSIDLDIIGEFSLAELKSILKDSIFLDVEEDEREPNRIPKKHFKIMYNSNIDSKPEPIILDILTANSPYAAIQNIPLCHPFIKLRLETIVRVPTLNSIFGDKLTAFAPNTLGVPYFIEKEGKQRIEKSMQLMKQLFDVGELFSKCEDLGEIRQSYERTVKLENSFRLKTYNITEVLDDTIRTAYSICRLDLKGAVENEQTKLIRKGIQQISNHLLVEKYGLLDARISAARAAYIATLLRYSIDETNLNTKKYSDAIKSSFDKSDLSKRLIPLVRLRNISDEAYYYWKEIDMVSDGLKNTELGE